MLVTKPENGPRVNTHLSVGGLRKKGRKKDKLGKSGMLLKNNSPDMKTFSEKSKNERSHNTCNVF